MKKKMLFQLDQFYTGLPQRLTRMKFPMLL